MKHKDLRPWLSVIAGGESLVSHAGAPTQDGRVVIDLDATLVTAHSDKEGAEPTFSC